MSTPKPILLIYIQTQDPTPTHDGLGEALKDVKEEYHVITITNIKVGFQNEVEFEMLSPSKSEEFNLAKVTRHIKNKLKKSGHTEFIIN